MSKLKKLLQEITYTLLPLFVLVAGYTAFLAATNMNLKDELTTQQKEVQKLNIDLGLAKSSLLTAKELEELYKEEVNRLDRDLQLLLKESELKLKSKDRTIANLKSKSSGGITKTTPSDPNQDKSPISYEWKDKDNRFHLIDPNIWIEGDETFTSDQKFMIEGFIFQAHGGQLQTKHLRIHEVIENKHGEWEKIPDGSTTIIDSKFDYTVDNPPKKSPPRLNCLNPLTYLKFLLN